jgi:hypothetical protein
MPSHVQGFVTQQDLKSGTGLKHRQRPSSHHQKASNNTASAETERNIMNVTEDDPDQLSNNATTTSSPTTAAPFVTTMSPTAAPFRTVSLSDDRTTAAPFFDSGTTASSPSTAPSFLFGGTTSSNSTGTTNTSTTSTSSTTILWPVILVFLLFVLLLVVLLVAIRMLSVRQKKINRRFRHRLNGCILLIAMALSIGAHISCNTWSFLVVYGGEYDESSRKAARDWSDLRAIGIWGVQWDDNEFCRYRHSTSRHETIARTLAVLATLMGGVSFMCWMNSQYDSKPKFLASLAVLFGIAAACAEGGALTALYRSLPCGNDSIDDLLVACTLWGSYQTATLGGVWPILAIVYWAAAMVVILWTVLVLGDDAIRESLNDNDN